MLALLACSALMAVGLDAPPADAKQAYQEARAKAGRAPDEQVKLALWCEARGLTAERLHHLTLAVLADPKNAAARGLMGLVFHDGRWLRPEALADKLKADKEHATALKEYADKRLKAPYTADAQWALGIWCDEHGLKDQAKAHLTAVTRLDPTRENAWKKLGYKRHEGRWATDTQLAAEKAEADAQKTADRKWKSTLEKYKAMLDQPSRRAEAEAALAEITDPRAVPMIAHAFVTGRAADQLRAVQLLGQVESPSASRVLAAMAVFSKSAEARRAAVETLKGRDPRDFVQLWIALVRQPIKYEVRPVGGPGSPGSLVVEGQRVNVKRVYSPPATPNFSVPQGTRLSYDENGLPVLTEPIGEFRDFGRLVWLPNPDPSSYINGTELAHALQHPKPGATRHDIIEAQMQAGASRVNYLPFFSSSDGIQPFLGNPLVASGNRPIFRERDLVIPIGEMELEARKSAQTAQQQLADDVAAIDRVNAAVRRANEPSVQALRAITGQEFGDDPTAWGKWWAENQGYVFRITATSDKPTVVENVPLGYTPQTTPQLVNGPVVRIGHSCFGGGTPVRMIDGDRPIESIRAGDMVLVQDTKTGGLAYHAVVTAYHNPPSPTLRVALEGESIVVTGIHRFWKAGRGWTMARDLKVGDVVRTLGGVAKVESIADDKTQPVFNLEVADGHSFLVGKHGALVHDNSLVEATPAPFDAAN